MRPAVRSTRRSNAISSFASGRRMLPSVARRSVLLEALERCYPKLRDLDVLAARLSGRSLWSRARETAVDLMPATSTVIDLCNHIIGRAVEVGASDVHVECGAAGTTVRYRICGVLEPVLTLPAAVSQPIRNRFKIMAKADIAIRHRPQDGAFRLKVNARPIDVRLSTLPTVDGEKIVMRVIDSYSPLQSLDRLGYDDDTLARFEKSLARPDGLVLVTGPTGSGKTTALYAALGHLRTGRTNIVSVEDPVERTVPGVTQIPVNPRAGNTFRDGPALADAAGPERDHGRRDPRRRGRADRRPGRLHRPSRAHLHAHRRRRDRDYPPVEPGLEPYKIAESLSAVLAQRLLRALCHGLPARSRRGRRTPPRRRIQDLRRPLSRPAPAASTAITPAIWGACRSPRC